MVQLSNYQDSGSLVKVMLILNQLYPMVSNSVKLTRELDMFYYVTLITLPKAVRGALKKNISQS